MQARGNRRLRPRLRALRLGELGVGLVPPLLVLGAWQLAVMLGWVDPQVLPAPSEVVHRLKEYMESGELREDVLGSLYRVALGFGLGAGLALPLGLAMGASRLVHAWMNPLVQVLRPIPPIAYIPLAMLWFGLGNPPALFLIALGAFFPVLMNTIVGVRQVDAIYLRAARNLGAGGATLFLRVILPAAAPYILSGLRIGIGTAFIVVIVSEMLAVNEGLGFRMLESREYFWPDKIIAGMISIGLLGLAIDIAMTLMNNYLLRWHRGLEN